MTKRILFLICDCVAMGDGSDCSLFVHAKDENEALEFWRDYFEFEDQERPERLVVVPEATGTVGGSIAWDSVTQIVYDREARKAAGLTPADDSKARGVIAALTEQAREG